LSCPDKNNFTKRIDQRRSSVLNIKNDLKSYRLLEIKKVHPIGG